MNKQIRILHVGMTPNKGGVESWIMNLYRNIDREKVQFDFLAKKNWTIAFEDEILKLGGKVFYETVGFNESIYHHYKCLHTFFKENYKNYDGIHVHSNFLNNIDVIKLAYKYDIPVRIIHSHNTNYAYKVSKLELLAEKRAKKGAPKKATNLWACSIDAGKWMFGENEFTVINNAIDTKKYSYNEKKRNDIKEKLKLTDKLVIGTVGRIEEQKNPYFILEIMERVVQRNSNAILLWVGEGNLKTDIEIKAKEMGIYNNIMFLGSRKDVNNILQGMDIFILPSKFEGFPVALIEAQTTGLKCLVSDQIPVETNITGLVEFLVLSDTNIWAEKILEYSNRYDRVCKSQQVRSAGYDMKEVVKNIEEFYITQSGKL